MKSVVSFFVLILLSSHLSAQAPDGVPTEGLVAWWNFDPSNIEEAEEFENGVLTSNRFGQPNQAIEFLGGGNCQSTCEGITFGVDTAVNTSFTFATWVKPTRSVTVRSESSSCYPSVSVPMANSNQNWVGFPPNGGSGQLGVGLSVGTNGIFVAEHATNLLVSRLSHPMVIDDFVHVVVVYEPTSAKLYVNGALVRSRPMHCGGVTKVLSGEAGINPYWPFRLAGGLYSPSFKGVLDDYAFWNRPLSEGEVTQLFELAEPVSGCLDSGACNFDEAANVDDGSCVYEGCNDPEACNFNGADICSVDCIYPAVGEDCSGGEGLCGEGTYWNASSQSCLVAVPGDFDYDGCINVNDLLGQLAVYNLCFDLSDIEFDCGLDKVNYQGYEYSTVQIGEDCWFAENLRATAFLNGDSIPTGLSGPDWSDATSPAVAVYGDGDGLTGNCCPGDGPDSDNEAYNLEVYGRLYNGWAKNDPRGLCPTGWHISDVSDWDGLVSHFGGYTSAGNALKGQDSLFVNWQPEGVEHFGALPAGYRDQAAGLYYYRGADAGFWTAQGSQHRRFRESLGAQMLTNNVSLQDGYSIRCVKD